MPAPVLSAAQVLDLADLGQSAHAAERGRLLLGAARPMWPEEELGAAARGDRDACVLALRRATFGDRVGGRTACPACGVKLVVGVEAADLVGAPDPPDPSVREPFVVRVGRRRVTVRSPDGEALARAA